MQWDTSKRLQVEMLKAIDEVTEERYFEMLEVLPPEAMALNAFLVGEPTDHHGGRPRYELYFTKENKFYYGGLASVKDFALWLIPAIA